MKRTLMMLVAALAMTVVASVQAADVKVNLHSRGANNQLTAAQNVKYTIANADGEIVAQGEGAEVALDLPNGNYEITVEQTMPNGQVRYGAQQMEVDGESEQFTFEITQNGLQPVEANGASATAERATVPRNPSLLRMNQETSPFQQPAVPQPSSNALASNANCGTWSVLGLVGAMVATSVALGVDDDDDPYWVSPGQWGYRGNSRLSVR